MTKLNMDEGSRSPSTITMPLQTQLGGHSEYYDEYTMPFLDGSSHNNLHSSYPTPVVHTGTSCSLFQVRLDSRKSPISLFTDPHYIFGFILGDFSAFISMRKYPKDFSMFSIFIGKLSKLINYRGRKNISQVW